MTETSDDIGKAVVRRAAERMADILTKQQDALLAEHSAMARWLTASLLVLNGGGALAVFNAADRLERALIDATPFIAGILAALSIGVLNQFANQAGVKIIGEALGQAFVVAETGEYSDEAQHLAETIEVRMREASRWSARAGWLSAALFLLGTIATGLDGPPSDQAALNRCATLQADMLASKPQRADSRDLFVTLKCTPSGQGQVHSLR